jgi:hypothetical protein
MFSDATIDVVSFTSCWQRQRSSKDNWTQTSELLTYDKEVQSVVKEDIKTQTEEEATAENRTASIAEDKSDNLLEFLRRVEPTICSQLERNLQSHAFDGYDVQWSDELSSISCLHSLSHAAIRSQLQCTDLAWNCTGSVLAVAYGRFDHEGSSSHQSFLCTWNVTRRAVNPNKADVTIDLAVSVIVNIGIGTVTWCS